MSLLQPRSIELHRGSPVRGARGFSLIEVLVAMVILVILASIVAPRFGAARRSESMLAGDQIEDLLRMWAYRSSIGTQQVGIWQKPDGFIAIQVRDTEGWEPTSGDVAPWIDDRLSNAVRLPSSVEIIEVQQNYEVQPLGEWFIQTNPDRSRPQVSISLRDSSNAVTVVSLEPYSNAPVRYDANTPAAIRQPIDLDAEGEETVSW